MNLSDHMKIVDIIDQRRQLVLQKVALSDIHRLVVFVNTVGTIHAMISKKGG